MSSNLFSGEPIPLVPNVESKEGMERWHFKVVEWMRRLGVNLDRSFNDPDPPSPGMARVQTIVLNIQRNQFGQTDVIASTDVFVGRGSPWGPITGGNAPVPWETDPNVTVNPIPWRDRPYLVGPGETGIEILEDGLYHVTFNIEPDTSQNLPPFDELMPLVDARIVLRVGNEALIPYGALASVEHLESFSIQGTYPIKEGTVIETECVIHFDDQAGPPRPVVRYDIGTNLQVLKLADGITGGNAQPPGFGWPTAVGVPPWIWATFGWE